MRTMSSSVSTSSRSSFSTRSTRSLRSTSPTSPTVTPANSLLSCPTEFPDWLPEDKKQDIVDLQVMTLSSPRGRVRRPRVRKRDPNHVPRPMNSFLSYRTEQQHFIRKYCPGANHREISKIVAKWWRGLDEKDKELYREQATSAKIEHAERYPDYKFTPKKKKAKTGEDPTFKVMDGKKAIKEEVLYTNIHDVDYSPLKQKSSCAYENGPATIDPAITAVANSAVEGYPDQFSFQDFLMSTYPYLDQKMLKLLQPYDANIMPDMLPDVPTLYMGEDPTLYPQQSPELDGEVAASTECTPMMDYSESPVDGCLDSPSIAYPPSFPLSNAYGPNMYEQQEFLWQY